MLTRSQFLHRAPNMTEVQPEAQPELTAASLQPEKWTLSANQVLQIFITDPSGAKHFQPAFTYPVFGEAEQIFGFKDLVIFLCFDHCTFYPFLNVRYSEKLKDESLEEPKDQLLRFLPESTIFKDEEEWADAIQVEQETYKVPGAQVGESFSRDGSTYAIYEIDLKLDSGLELLKRLQFLTLLFIEAASYIDSADPLWDLYVLYKIDDPKLPSVVGLCTAYNYWKYPGATDFDAGKEEVRKKLSQFIILPTHQGARLGGEFYNHLFELWKKDEKVVEVVVEDPNENFDDLRDRSDYTRLVDQGVFDLPKMNISLVTSHWRDTTRKEQKLERRQFSRLVEMALLHKLKSGIPGVSNKEVRLFIKQRLFEKNKEALLGLDEATRKDKLHTAYESLAQDYYRILEPFKKREQEDAESGTSKKARLE